MVVKKKKKTGTSDLSNKDLLRILMQEIADVRHELKQDIGQLDMKLTGKIDSVHTSLKIDIQDVRKEVHASRAESHQNQVAFITNIQDHERRIVALER